MKKLNKILAVASTVLFLTCTAGVETQAEVILNEKDIPVKLEYSSEAPSSDEIFRICKNLRIMLKKEETQSHLPTRKKYIQSV